MSTDSEIEDRTRLSCRPAAKKIARCARLYRSQGERFHHPDLRWTDAIRFRAAYAYAKRKYK